MIAQEDDLDVPGRLRAAAEDARDPIIAAALRLIANEWLSTSDGEAPTTLPQAEEPAFADARDG